MGTELPFCKMKSVLGTDGGDGGQTRRTSLMPRLVHLKMVNTVHVALYGCTVF